MIGVCRHEAPQPLDCVKAGASAGPQIEHEILVVQRQLAEAALGKIVISDEPRNFVE